MNLLRTLGGSWSEMSAAAFCIYNHATAHPEEVIESIDFDDMSTVIPMQDEMDHMSDIDWSMFDAIDPPVPSHPLPPILLAFPGPPPPPAPMDGPPTVPL